MTISGGLYLQDAASLGVVLAHKVHQHLHSVREGYVWDIAFMHAHPLSSTTTLLFFSFHLLLSLPHTSVSGRGISTFSST